MQTMSSKIDEFAGPWIELAVSSLADLLVCHAHKQAKH
jgi:hypothetical protein